MQPQELAASIYRIAHLDGEFKLRSGLTSRHYFDKYRFESQPKILKAIAQAMTSLIPDGTEVLAGLEMGGIPVATALSLESGLPVVFVRKEAKSYGTCRLAEGLETLKDKRLLMIEDVITTGGQVILSAQDLKAEGALVGDVLCVISREQGGEEKLKNAGLRMISLFTQSQLSANAASP